MTKGGISLIALSAILGLCASRAWAETATAKIRGTAEEGSLITGRATFTDQAGADEASAGALLIHVEVANVPPGKHGIHIHQLGDCGNIGKAAGGHYNPEGAPHGHPPADGMAHAHAGDLGNIEVGPDGTGTLELTIPGLSVSDGLRTVAGRSVILHEKEDDFGQPVGNAGGRIGCGPIIVTGE